MQTENSPSSQHIVGPHGEHYKTHGEAPLASKGHVRVYTCSVRGSEDCSVALSIDEGGLSVLVKFTANGARQLLALVTEAAEAAEAVDIQIKRLAEQAAAEATR